MVVMVMVRMVLIVMMATVMVTMLNRAIVSHGPGVTHWAVCIVSVKILQCQRQPQSCLRCVQIWNPKHADALLNRHICRMGLQLHQMMSRDVDTL